MANIKSKQKNIRRIEKKTIRNRSIKSKVKKAIKKVYLAIENNDKNVKEKISFAHSEINKAMSKGVFHKNTAARKNSRLDAYYNKKLSSTKK